ncbi:MAG TPA: aquaporin [Candidatus Binatia bacterium]|nr:aquaporin [Candidatus Binatia bacterium]
MFGKKKLAMLVAELVGTSILTLVVLSVRSSGIGYSFFVALAAGIAVMALTLAVGATSGAQFNPALTFGLWTARKIKTLPAIVYIAVQLLGGACAYWLYAYLVKNHLQNTGGHYEARIFLSEAIGTFIFVWGWTAAAAKKFTGLQFAVAAGGAFALGIIVASIASGGIINPAIALGTRSWGWTTYVLGPVVGGLVGANVQSMLFSGTEVAEASAATRVTSSSTTTTVVKKTSRKKK